MNHQLQQLVAQTVTHFTSVNMLSINASNIPQSKHTKLYGINIISMTGSKPEVDPSKFGPSVSV